MKILDTKKETLETSTLPITVTQPFLPPLEEFMPYLKNIWDKKRLTNQGEYHKEFEEALADYLGVKYVSLFANGTLALITALHALHITGEVITTPYSFVATTHSLFWNKIKPIFVDIAPSSFNLDPEKIEEAITADTTAILPVHVYGYPCEVERMQDIAHAHGLKIIYDAAHAFGVMKGDQSILNFGDLSILSFHATKVFNTFEGGAIVCHDENMKKRIDHLKNFGFAGETTVVGPGINAKMNEFQAALGLLQLTYINDVILRRKELFALYQEKLEGVDGITLSKEDDTVTYNYAYFPILVDETLLGCSRDDVYTILREHNIFARRYFYPLISTFSPYREMPSAHAENIPIAEKIAQKVLCLPIYPDLSDEQIDFIVTLIKEVTREYGR